MDVELAADMWGDAFAEEARHFGCFAADEGAVGFSTAACYA